MSGVSVPPSLVIARHSAWWSSFAPLLHPASDTRPTSYRRPAAAPAADRP